MQRYKIILAVIILEISTGPGIYYCCWWWGWWWWLWSILGKMIFLPEVWFPNWFLEPTWWPRCKELNGTMQTLIQDFSFVTLWTFIQIKWGIVNQLRTLIIQINRNLTTISLSLLSSSHWSVPWFWIQTKINFICRHKVKTPAKLELIYTKSPNHLPCMFSFTSFICQNRDKS